jgi:phosphoheptose isomerase
MVDILEASNRCGRANLMKVSSRERLSEVFSALVECVARPGDVTEDSRHTGKSLKIVEISEKCLQFRIKGTVSR